MKRARMTLKMNAYRVTDRAVEDGIIYGISRFNKYSDRPLTPEENVLLHEQLSREILNALCEVIDFGDDDVDD